VAKGEGGPYVQAGNTCLTTVIGRDTSGGPEGQGPPGGRHGAAQICDLALHIRAGWPSSAR